MGRQQGFVYWLGLLCATLLLGNCPGVSGQTLSSPSGSGDPRQPALNLKGLRGPAETVPQSGSRQGQPSGNRYYLKGKEITEAEYQAIINFNESYESFRSGNYELAAEKLRKAVSLNPNMSEARCNLGLVLARLGEIDESVKQLKQCIALYPGRSEPWATLAGVYQGSGQLTEAIAAYKEFLKRFPKDPMAAKAACLVKDLQKELGEEAEVAKTLKPGEGQDDYFAYTTYDGVTKWPAEKMPLKVFLNEPTAGNAPQNYRSEFGGALRDSFAEWEAKSAGKVAFKFVDDPATADIDCLWTADITKVTRPSERGEAKIAFSSRGIEHVTIVVLTCQMAVDDNRLPEHVIHTACLHEIGHGLGLMGHSPSPSDVMFCSVPAADKKRELSARDSATVVHLYQPEVLTAYKFHEGKTNPNDKIVLNNEGVDQASAGNFRQAAEKFEACLKLDPTYEPARRNLGAVLNNVAIELTEASNFKEAEYYFKRAMQMQNNENNPKKRASTFHNYAFLLRKLNRLAEAGKMESAAGSLITRPAVTSLKGR